MSECEKNQFTPSSKAAAAGGYSVDDDDEEEDEADFDPNNDDSYVSSSSDDAYDDEEDENGEVSATIVTLSGSLTFGEEKHVIYSGTWHLLGCEDSMNSTANTFQLKSNHKFTTFDLSNPTSGMKSRTLLFHGVYATSKSEEGDEHRSKTKEKDVEITFTDVSQEAVSSPKPTPKDHGTSKSINTSTSTKLFHVTGKGSNEYGPFRITGEYKVSIEGSNTETPSKATQEREEMICHNALVCDKTYIVKPKHRTKRSRHSEYLSDDDDSDSDGDGGGADFEELAALHEEACMSVEELRRRYVDSNESEDPPSDDDKKPAACDHDDDRKPSAKERKTECEEELKSPAKKKKRQQHQNAESDEEYTF